MNEATFEANLNAALDRIFTGPVRPKIKHQKTLVLKLGHHVIPVDGVAKTEARGRLDVLLVVNDRNLAVFELKSPENALTEDDETQAWSYARLLHPMPPFYIVSNGDETRIFRTYDRSRVGGETLDEQAIHAGFSAATSAAAADEREAIHCLLGRSPEVFRTVFKRISRKQLEFVMGTAEEMTQPVCKDFGIMRDATFALYQAVAIDGIPVVALVGEALCGKTNVAADLVHYSYAGPIKASIAPVYINCEHLAQGLLQTLANEVSIETGVAATADDVRHWLRSRILTATGARPVVLIDSWSPNGSARYSEELSELLDLSTQDTFSIAVIVDSAYADQVMTTGRRAQPSKLGDLAVRIPVPRLLSDRELRVAEGLLAQRASLTLEPGAQWNAMYRLPWTWRMLAALEAREAGVLPATLGAEQLHNILNNHALSAEQLDDLRAYCEAVLDDETTGRERFDLTPGWLSLRYAKETLGETRLNRLINGGLVRLRTTHEQRAIVTPQVPSLTAALGASIVRERLGGLLEQRPVAEAVDLFLEMCGRLPHYELVGPAAILHEDFSEENTDAVMERLLELEPSITERTVTVTTGSTRRPSESRLAPVYENVLPFMIASQVVRWPAVHDGRVSESVMTSIRRIADSHVPLFTPYQPDDAPAYLAPEMGYYKLRDGGVVLADTNGVIEPVTDALRHIALYAPDDFADFVESLLHDDRPGFPLLYRTWLAADSVAKMPTPVASRAESCADSLDALIQARMPEELKKPLP